MTEPDKNVYEDEIVPKCPKCKGSGKVRRKRRNNTCFYCKGSGVKKIRYSETFFPREKVMMAIACSKNDPDVCYVAGQMCIWKIKRDEPRQRIFGGVNPGFEEGSWREARFLCLGDMVADEDERLFVTDYPNNRIRLCDIKTGKVMTIAGHNNSTHVMSFREKHQRDDLAPFQQITGIAYDRVRRHIYVADGAYIRRLYLPPLGTELDATEWTLKHSTVAHNVEFVDGVAREVKLYGMCFDPDRYCLWATSTIEMVKIDLREGYTVDDNFPYGDRCHRACQTRYTATPALDPCSQHVLFNGYDQDPLQWMVENDGAWAMENAENHVHADFPLLAWHSLTDRIWLSRNQSDLVEVRLQNEIYELKPPRILIPPPQHNGLDVIECPRCEGRRMEGDEVCSLCRGEGTVKLQDDVVAIEDGYSDAKTDRSSD